MAILTIKIYNSNAILNASPHRRLQSILPFLACLMIALTGCATDHPNRAEIRRPFNFQTDTFVYPNDLVWEYHFDEHGKWISKPRKPRPDYTHHCFVVARSTRQFFEHARFDPTQPAADETNYRRLIHKVISKSPGRSLAECDKVVIPGYANLHEFSEGQAPLLKAECGGAWQSYFQHGHWRMLLPFSRHHQQEMSKQLLTELRENKPPVVHLVRFPQLTINHAVVLFDATETDKEIRFAAYDPNNPKVPVPLTYDRTSRTFEFPANDYYPGGRVDVYEVYQDWRY